jgi:hypothetical protein
VFRSDRNRRRQPEQKDGATELRHAAIQLG